MTLGPPAAIRACLFDLDGVITDTTSLYAAAWKEAFDTLLQQHEGEGFRPFAADTGYDEFFDGRSSAEGVRCFLSSRGIERPDGSPDDPPGPDTVYGLVRWKNSLFEARTRSQGVQVYQDTMAYVMAARDSGLLTAVVTSSANCREILRAARMETLFDAWIDGVVAASRNLRGKPHPTHSWQLPAIWASTLHSARYSRTRRQAWTPDDRVTSGGWSASPGQSAPGRCARMAPMWSSKTWET